MRPLILVSNDDSYTAPGVHALIDRLVNFGDVVAVCPNLPHSGQSMAITVNGPLRINELPDYNGARMFNVTGTPVDCIKLSMHHILGRRPNLVVAGINHGSNAAINNLYSGTMGAAMEGAVFGIPSIGFSLTNHSMTANFQPCNDTVDLITRWTLEKGLPQDVALNVNVPAIDHTPTEMRLCTPCRGMWNDEYKEYTDPYGKKFYWLTGEYINLEPENEHTDEWALHHDMVSVVPVNIMRYDHEPLMPDWLAAMVDEYNKTHKH